jgi:hypothetical protein
MNLFIEIFCVPTKDKKFIEWPKMQAPNAAAPVIIPFSNWQEAANTDKFTVLKGR